MDSSAKAKLSYRLRDVLMKEWTLVGIPSVIVALVSLAKVEGEAEMVKAGVCELDPLSAAIRPALGLPQPVTGSSRVRPGSR